MKTSSCRKIEEKLPEIATGNLPDTDKRWVADHLRQCAACSGEAGWLRNFRSLAKSLQPRIEAALPELRSCFYNDLQRAVLYRTTVLVRTDTRKCQHAVM